MQHWRTTGNSNMATQTGSTYTLYLWKYGRYRQNSNSKPAVFYHGELKNSTISDYNCNDMVANTGNTYISVIRTDSVEISTANLGIWAQETVPGFLWEWPTTRNGNVKTFWPPILPFWVVVIVAITCYRASRGGKSRICWSFDAVCHNSRDIIISTF